MPQINQELKEQLDALQKSIQQIQQQFSLDDLERHLVRYSDFVLDIKNRLEAVENAEDFRAFRDEWKQCEGIRKLPKELSAFHEYQSLVEQYNALVIPALLQGADTTPYRPVFMGQREFDICQNETPLYNRPFSWEKLKERLVGPATRNAVYTHAVACMEPNEIISMIEDGFIRWETITSLPYAVSVRGTNGGANARLYQKHYHEHLSAVYDHFGYKLPDIIHREEPLKGVTFEGRPEKIRYIMQRLVSPSDKNLVLKAERYLFEKDGVKEPAIRVIASIPRDRQFQDICIGNLDRNLAISIDKEHPNATLVLDLKEMGYFESSSESGSVRTPYAKMNLQIADRPVEKAKKKDNHSREMDELFSMDEIN